MEFSIFEIILVSIFCIGYPLYICFLFMLVVYMTIAMCKPLIVEIISEVIIEKQLQVIKPMTQRYKENIN